MTIPAGLQDVIVVDPDLMSGAPTFRGTRVPLYLFLDHLEAGASLDSFHTGFPTVSPEQTRVVLQWLARESRELIQLDPAS